MKSQVSHKLHKLKHMSEKPHTFSTCEEFYEAYIKIYKKIIKENKFINAPILNKETCSTLQGG